VALEVGPQHFRDGQDVMTMRDGGQHMVGDKIGGGLDLALVAGRAEPAAFAGEGQEVFMLAFVTADPCEPSFEIAAVQEFADHFRDGRAKGAKIGLVLFGLSFNR